MFILKPLQNEHFERRLEAPSRFQENPGRALRGFRKGFDGQVVGWQPRRSAIRHVDGNSGTQIRNLCRHIRRGSMTGSSQHGRLEKQHHWNPGGLDEANAVSFLEIMEIVFQKVSNDKEGLEEI